MIRSVLAFLLFAIFVCAAIILGPKEDGPPLVGLPAAPEALAPQAPTDVSMNPQVTRGAVSPMDLPTAESRIAVPQDSQVQTTPAIRTDTDLRMEDMTTNVLAELGLLPESALILPERDPAQVGTAAALAEIAAVAGRNTRLSEPEDLPSLVVVALLEGQEDALIDQIVNTAAAEGRVAVPEILVTSDGRVDTSLLLSNILVQARAATGQTAPPKRAETLADVRGLEVRLIQVVDGTTEARFYTVQRGDSLGAIAVKFYGNAYEYPRIFGANRQTLTSPDRIRTGQRLVIPEI